MNITERVHGTYVHSRRVRVLAGHLAEMIPDNASLIDIGCGDTRLAALLADSRADLKVHCIDTHPRQHTLLPVEIFDGSVIPRADKSIDVALFVDVLHHTDDPLVLLSEARRVARRAIVLKDHTRDGWLAGPTLEFMDRVGNERYGVTLPFNYWTRAQWLEAFDTLKLKVSEWRGQLGLYPWPASLVFGRSLHFIARLEMDN